VDGAEGLTNSNADCTS